jgi:hypothetical protein
MGLLLSSDVVSTRYAHIASSTEIKQRIRKIINESFEK